MGNEIKKDMILGIQSFLLISEFVKNDELRELVISVQNNVKKSLKRGNYNRGI